MADKLEEIRSQFVKFCSKVTLQLIIDALRHEGILSETEVEHIISHHGHADKCRTLIDIVINKGDHSSNVLLRTLVKYEKAFSEHLGISAKFSSPVPAKDTKDAHPFLSVDADIKPSDKLKEIRSQFVNYCSNSTLQLIVNTLHREGILSVSKHIESHYERANICQTLIDTVISRGDFSSNVLLETIMKYDKALSERLGISENLPLSIEEQNPDKYFQSVHADVKPSDDFSVSTVLEGLFQPDAALGESHENLLMSVPEMKADILSCNLCDKSQKSVEILTPTMSGSTYCLSMDSPGLFRCSESGIQFQVTQPVTIEYEVDSWSNYSENLQNLNGGYEIIGPLFNIKSRVEPNVVSEVYLPHCLCLGGFTEDKSLIRCFHYKDDNMVFEAPSRVESMYAVLENPTFSSFGVILYPLYLLKEEIIKFIPYHGMVLIFCKTFTRDDLKYKYRLHLYLLPMIRTVEKEVELSKARFSFQRIPKPPQTKSVYSKKQYRISGPPGAHVLPKTLLFENHNHTEIPPFTEITIEGGVSLEVNVSVHPEDTDVIIWETVVSAEEMLELPSGGHIRSHQQRIHFVDKHRAVLIEVISEVDRVLDDLLDEDLLTYEQYETVCSKSTNQKKMRELYRYIRAWGNEDKDKVYNALRNYNGPVIKKMENGLQASSGLSFVNLY